MAFVHITQPLVRFTIPPSDHTPISLHDMPNPSVKGLACGRPLTSNVGRLMRPYAFIPWLALLCCTVSGCDTLHGVRISLMGAPDQLPVRACVEKSLRQLDLEAVPLDGERVGIRILGESGYTFFGSYEKPNRASFYLMTMNAPLSCETVAQVVPRMRAAAAAAQMACSLPNSPIEIAETWSQTRCGL